MTSKKVALLMLCAFLLGTLWKQCGLKDELKGELMNNENQIHAYIIDQNGIEILRKHLPPIAWELLNFNHLRKVEGVRKKKVVPEKENE